jgi:DNA-binding transcriptional LysR family regulator
MTINSSQLEAFSTLARTGNFTRAGKQIGITQSALSQRIFNLESELRATLLIRGKTGISLTEAGKQLLRYCQTQEQFESELLSEFHATHSHDSGLSRNHAGTRSSAMIGGILRVGGYSSVMRSVFIPKISSLLKKHPTIQSHLLTRELSELPALLKSGEIDYIILDRKLENEDLDSIQIGEEEHVLVEARDYKNGEIYLDHDAEDETTANYLSSLTGEKTNRRTLKYKRVFLDDVYGIVDGVKMGLGKGVLPKHLIDKEKNLRILRPTHVVKNPIVLHFYQQPYYSKLHIAMTELLNSRQQLKKSPTN